ncbi:hypothetical protein KCV01_g8658, partial [Aureobasidium melanogenum]
MQSRDRQCALHVVDEFAERIALLAPPSAPEVMHRFDGECQLGFRRRKHAQVASQRRLFDHPGRVDAKHVRDQAAQCLIDIHASPPVFPWPNLLAS